MLFRSVETAKATVTFKETSLAAAELRYQQGQISANALQTAKDEVATAKVAVDTAQLNLLMAQNQYLWAMTNGIV